MNSTITTMAAIGRESAEAYHKAIKHWSKKPISQALDEQQECMWLQTCAQHKIEYAQTIEMPLHTPLEIWAYLECWNYAQQWQECNPKADMP